MLTQEARGRRGRGGGQLAQPTPGCQVQPAEPPWAAHFLNAGLGLRVCAHSGAPPSPSPTALSAAGRRYKLVEEPFPELHGGHVWEPPRGRFGCISAKEEKGSHEPTSCDAPSRSLLRATRILVSPSPTLTQRDLETRETAGIAEISGQQPPRGHFCARQAGALQEPGFQQHCFALTA